jgi:RNA 2',3'-cyclic 3'-phosphodiesterase
MDEIPQRKKRLFIAIPLPSDLQANLESLQAQLKPYARDAKWVPVRGIHLTLKFLGYVDPVRVSEISRSLAQVASSARPSTALARSCGFFPNSRRPSVLWVGVQSDGLQQLQKQTEDAIANLGFEKEDRAFSPHLTLARFRDPRGLLPLAQEVAKFDDRSFGNFGIDEIILFESILGRRGADYQALGRFSLSSTEL